MTRQPESDNPRVYSDTLHAMSWGEYAQLVLTEREKQETRRNARRLLWRALCWVGLLAATAGLLMLYAPLVMGR
jgi:hypothetical protein